MNENATPRPTIHESERTYLGKLLLAAKVILEAAPDLSLVSDPLEVELGIFKDRVEFALLLPEAATVALPWRDGHGNAPRLAALKGGIAPAGLPVLSPDRKAKAPGSMRSPGAFVLTLEPL